MDNDRDPAPETQDDVFYAELRRRILLLTEDDDAGDDFLESRRSNPMTVVKEASSMGRSAASIPGSHFSWLEDENGSSVPTWLLNLWGNGNGGTGVFIPHIVKSRRRHRPRKKKNDGQRTYTPVGHKNE